jgi:hypothetical protein
MCSKCAERTPVGYRCKECIRGQKAVFETATPRDTLLAFVTMALIGLVLALVGNFIETISGFGLYLAILFIPAGGVLGTWLATLTLKISGKRRSKLLFMVSTIGFLLGAVLSLVPCIGINLFMLLDSNTNISASSLLGLPIGTTVLVVATAFGLYGGLTGFRINR